MYGTLYLVPTYGEMAEWLKAPHSKRGRPERVSGVQISLSPPIQNTPHFKVVFLFNLLCII